ncbi:MAG: hypothetical protein EPN17_17010 [Methylobacter sp.]|nr:MAG: hypothetical protein EPN17_17010 [Methylobacter sp.]
MILRLILSILLPFMALGLQWILWPWIAPFVRFFFIPPQLSWTLDNPANLHSVGMFLVMGYLFSETQDRLRLAQRNSETALAKTSSVLMSVTSYARH